MSTTAETLPPPESGSPSESKYDILRPDSYHTQITGQEELLEKYVRLLSPLIERMAGDETQPAFDTVVFLDKSARPLYWMVRDFWPHIAPQKLNEETGQPETAPRPDIRFANIDRLNWRNDPAVEIDEGGMKPITKDDVKGLRAIFQPRDSRTIGLDGQRVLLIDEQAETGDTLKVARRLFEKTFPSADIETYAWISHPHSVNRAGQRESAIKEIPMWYPPKDQTTSLHKETGRGVRNPVPFRANDPEHGDPERFPPGSYPFLSTKPYVPKREYTDSERLELARLRRELDQATDPEEKAELLSDIKSLRQERDQESLKLRREIGQMVLDFESGRISPYISTDRQEILGMPADEYNRQAKERRQQRR